MGLFVRANSTSQLVGSKRYSLDISSFRGPRLATTLQVLKKRLPISAVQGTKASAGDHENGFIVETSEKEVTLVAETPMDKILWLHSIDCARKGTFNTLPQPIASSPAALVR